MAKDYNYIYSKLVKNNNDLVGLIAYALYKQHKIEFIESFKANNNQQDPSEADFNSFYIGTCTQSSLSNYRDEAQNLLEKITLAAAREEINEFEESMLRDYKKEIEIAVKKNNPKWWISVGYSVIGAIVFSLFIALGSFLGSTSEKENVQMILNTVNSIIPKNNDIYYKTPVDTIEQSEIKIENLELIK